MSDEHDVQHRAYHQPDADQVTLRETDDDDDGVFVVRMPIASTGEVRNQGDDPLARDELDGMAQQIEERPIGVFLDHGQSSLGGGGGMFGNRYSAVGKVGEWADPDVVDAGEEDLLEADARLMDPDSLPESTGNVREALAALKAQVERGLSLSSSIGWREDDAYPGGNDLAEASIVGIGADPRTTSQGSPAEAMARAAVEAGADAEAFLDKIRAAVMGPGETRRDDTMSDGDTDTQSDPDPDGEGEDETTGEQDEQRDTPEWAQELLEEQRKQTDLLETIDDAVRQEDEEDQPDGDEEDEGDDEEDDEEEEEEQSADDERRLVVDGEEMTADDVRELRGQLADADVDPDSEPDDERDGDGETETAGQSDGPDWRA